MEEVEVTIGTLVYKERGIVTAATHGVVKLLRNTAFRKDNKDN